MLHQPAGSAFDIIDTENKVLYLPTFANELLCLRKDVLTK